MKVIDLSDTPIKNPADDAVTVRDYLAALNATLTEHGGRIIGEVTECKPWNGHVYFSLKDESGEAILSCAIWKSNYMRAGIELENGMEVIISGVPNIYVKNGRFSFIANTLELVGEGALKKQYEKMKAKLAAEGLFAEERKRALPLYPKTIGVITSMKGGVVIHDYSNNLKKFGFVSKIVDSRVEGPDAIKELIDSVRTLKKENVDVLVIIRGGGSLESFAAFNNEALVREVADFPVPVIVGVGHHVDVCLVGLVADRMVSTPTAVAALLNESWEQALYELRVQKQFILSSYAGLLAEKRSDIQRSSSIIQNGFNAVFERFRESERILKNAMYKFESTLQARRDLMSVSLEAVFRRFSDAIHTVSRTLEHSEKNILQNDPNRQLRLGYSIIKSNDKIVRSVAGLKEGDRVTLNLADGAAESEIKKVTRAD